MRAGLQLSKGLYHMQQIKYKIIGTIISIICIALMSIIIYDCREIEGRKTNTKKNRDTC